MDKNVLHYKLSTVYANVMAYYVHQTDMVANSFETPLFVGCSIRQYFQYKHIEILHLYNERKGCSKILFKFNGNIIEFPHFPDSQIITAVEISGNCILLKTLNNEEFRPIFLKSKMLVSLWLFDFKNNTYCSIPQYEAKILEDVIFNGEIIVKGEKFKRIPYDNQSFLEFKPLGFYKDMKVGTVKIRNKNTNQFTHSFSMAVPDNLNWQQETIQKKIIRAVENYL